MTDNTNDHSPTFHLEEAVALVTGANRGLGRHFVTQLLERGARVYAGARRPDSVDVPGAIPIRLDVTNDHDIAAATKSAADVTLVINNAGISNWTDLLTADLHALRQEMQTNFWGTLAMARAFAPVLAGNGGGALMNVLSAQSWFAYPGTNGYHASKAAAWALTNGLRWELAEQGTQVLGLHLGPIDTDFSAVYQGAKGDPATTARAGLDGLEAGHAEVIADEWTAHVKQSLATAPEQLDAEIRAGVV